MKRFFVLLFLLFSAMKVFAGDFAPSKLTLSAPESIYYREMVQGQDLEIPVMVSGTPATVVFLVFTKDGYLYIDNVRNGYLGWHQVNKIDTCIYVSEPYQFNPGTNTVVWDGRNQDGNRVFPESDYSYYMFGYDHVSAKIPVTLHLPYVWDDTNIIITRDGAGNPLTNPVIYSGVNEWKEQQGAWERIRTKWIVGNDPDNKSLAETTLYSGWNEHCQLIPDPQDANLFLINTIDNNSIAHMRKYKWVPNDEAELVRGFGDDGELHWVLNSLPGEWCAHQPLRYIGDDFIITTATDFKGVSDTAELIVVEVEDGSILLIIDLSEWWISEADRNAGGQKSSGPTDMDVMHGKLILGSHTSCLNQMIDPFDFEDDNWNLWVNGNGDFVGDKNFGEDSERPWVCNDYKQVPYKYSIALDDNLFSIFPADGIGNNSFGLYAPDGTGIGYFSFANETAGFKFGQRIVDTGSAYDGIYCDNASLDEQAGGMWYVAHDSIKGTINTSHVLCVIRIVSPNGGEIWKAGSVQDISWYLGDIVKLAKPAEREFTLEYTIDGGLNWKIIDESVNLADLSYSWVVPDVESSECLVRLTDKEWENWSDISDNFFTITKGSYVENTDVKRFEVFQNSPNPFNPETTISFTLPESGAATVEIYNTAGQMVDTVAERYMTTGSHSVVWNAEGFSAGIYFCTVRSGQYSGTIKMTVLR